MNLRISLIAFFLFGIGIFANAQEKEKSKIKIQNTKPIVENGADLIPVTVTGSNKKNKPKPPKAPEPVKFTPPVIVKNGDKAPPPPVIKKGGRKPPAY